MLRSLSCFRGGSTKRCTQQPAATKLLNHAFFCRTKPLRTYTIFQSFQDGIIEPYCVYDGVKIYVVSTLPELLTSLKLLQTSIKKHKLKHVGFDTEKEAYVEQKSEKSILPSKRVGSSKGTPKKLALAQFTTEDVCILIRLPLVYKDIQEATRLLVFPREFLEFLENKKIFKVGVSASWDSHALKAEYKLLVRGVVNLDRIAKNMGHGTTSLKSLCNRYKVGINPINVSNKQWFQKELSRSSVLYAAKDAIAGYRLFKMMKYEIDQKGLSIPVARKRK